MSEIVKRLKLNKLNLFVTLLIASAAAFCTLFFALFEGVQNIATIIFRVFISFAVFAVIGYFIAEIFENEYLNTLKNVDKNDVSEKTSPIDNDNEQDNAIETNEVENTLENEPALNIERVDEENDMKMLDDDSFDKIVVVDKDTDE